MANRKVLINRHSTKNEAPLASEMFHGEIAVSHPSEVSATTIYTRNGNEMVPFISCAQTISIIDGKIAEVNVVYDVKEGENEPHIDVAKSQVGSSVTFTLTSDDIESKAEFEAFSAETKARIDKNVSAITDTLGIISALTDVVVTDISGDTIIVAEPVENGSGSNSYNLTHKQAPAAVALGFNKLATDAYGHVTAATAVATEDIQALGFKTSAQTGEDIEALSASVVTNKTNIEALSAGTQHDIEALSGDVVEYVKVVSGNIETVINELSANTTAGDAAVFASAKTYTDEQIEALDSAISASTGGKYLTAISIKDGKLDKIEEADIPVLSSAKTGDGNVVTEVTVNGHEVTYVLGATVATSEDLNALSASVISLSAATTAISEDLSELSGITKDFSGYTDAKFTALSAGTIQLSADTKATIEQLSGATVAEFNSAFTAIQAMDKAADVVAGQVVTTVAQEDGKVTETKANVKDLQLGGYSKDTTATGDIESTDTINAALSKLENKAAAITIANADKSINVTTGATGTDINVNIKSGEKVLAKDGDAGLYTDIDLVKITTGLPAEIKERYQLLATDNSQIGVNIDVPKDSHIVSINYITTGEHAQNLEYVYIDASGVTQTTYVDMSELVLEAEFASGVTVTDHIAHGVVDPASESFLTVGGAGFKLSGVQDAIDAKVNALDVTGDTAAAGQYVAAIEQTDGVVAVKTRANVSEAVLTNYAKGTDATAVAATDTVNQAIGKLENQIDAAKAAATTKVVEGTDAGNNMTITSAAGADNSVTYTVNLVDIASSTALTAEIAARKAVYGQNGDTYAANAGTNFISGATSLNDADVKLDAAIKALSGDTDAAIKALDSVGSASTTGHYLTSVTITDGKITAVGEVAVPANVAITATTGAAGDTPSAVLTGVTASGTDSHELTFGMSNKVFSATTADSALTSQSALTSVSATVAADAVHASAATKVDSALTLTDVAGTNSVVFDGSNNQTVTFGKAVGSIGNSMSMDANGVVDVEIIDCGEY